MAPGRPGPVWQDGPIDASPLPRRTLLGAGLASAAAALAGCAEPASWRAPAPAGSASPGPSGGPSAPSSTGPPSTTSRPAGGLTDKLVATLSRHLRPTPQHPKHPGYAGAVVLVTVGGAVRAHAAVGHALRYGVGPVDLPAARRVAMRPDSVFDLASITKVFTALLVLRQVDRGRVELDAPVAEYLPAFGGGAKDDVTIAMLLAHTGGLPVGVNLAGLSTGAQRRAAILATPLVPGAVPGTGVPVLRHRPHGARAGRGEGDRRGPRPAVAGRRDRAAGPA